MERQFDIRDLIASGKFLHPTKVKISYRYKTSPGTHAQVTIKGIGRDEAVPSDILSATNLLDTVTPKLEAVMLINIDDVGEATDIVVTISNHEYLAKLYMIELVVMPEEIEQNEYAL